MNRIFNDFNVALLPVGKIKYYRLNIGNFFDARVADLRFGSRNDNFHGFPAHNY